METRARQLNHYKDFIKNNPEGSYKTVGWGKKETQQVCYDSILKMINVTDSPKILDVGCGCGYMAIDGIDILPEMIDIAKKKYPSGHYEVSDIMTYKPKKQYDYMIAVGTFNVSTGEPLDDYMELFKAVERMWALSKKGVVINCLRNDIHVQPKHKDLSYRNWRQWAEIFFGRYSPHIKIEIVDHTFTLGVFK